MNLMRHAMRGRMAYINASARAGKKTACNLAAMPDFSAFLDLGVKAATNRLQSLQARRDAARARLQASQAAAEMPVYQPMPAQREPLIKNIALIGLGAAVLVGGFFFLGRKR